MELDQLYKRVQRSHNERLAFLQKYPELIAQRDDLVLEEISYLFQFLIDTINILPLILFVQCG